MRPGHAAGRTDETNLLATLYGVTCGDQWLAHMEVTGDQSAAVVDVHNVAREKKVGDESDHAAIRGVDRLAEGSAVIHAEVSAGELSVEDAASPEPARDRRLARP